MKLRQQFALITVGTIALLVIVLYIAVSALMTGGGLDTMHPSLITGGGTEAVHPAFRTEVLRNALLLLLGCGGAVLLVVVVAGERLITQPLIDMSRDAIAIASNPELERRICLQGGDELRSLGIALNRMLDTLDNSYRQLRDTRDEAERANRSKSDFLAVVSHEIRTPLSGITGLAELLAETTLDEQQHELLASLQLSVAGLQDILNDILDLSKIEAGRMELEKLPFCPRTLLINTLTPYQLQTRRKGLEFTHEVHDDVPERLMGDCGRLRQILLNLVVNAIKFTHQGFIRVSLQVSTVQGAQKSFVLTVADSGIGMTPDVCRRIFLPFTQADLSTRREYGGTGLGLTIVSQLTALMEGTVSVESAPGSGSCFTVCIPFGSCLYTDA